MHFRTPTVWHTVKLRHFEVFVSWIFFTVSIIQYWYFFTARCARNESAAAVPSAKLLSNYSRCATHSKRPASNKLRPSWYTTHDGSDSQPTRHSTRDTIAWTGIETPRDSSDTHQRTIRSCQPTWRAWSFMTYLSRPSRYEFTMAHSSYSTILYSYFCQLTRLIFYICPIVCVQLVLIRSHTSDDWRSQSVYSQYQECVIDICCFYNNNSFCPTWSCLYTCPTLDALLFVVCPRAVVLFGVER